MKRKSNMEEDLIVINNIKSLKKNIDSLKNIAIQNQSNYPKLKIIEEITEQYQQQIAKEKEKHNHNLILYLGTRESKKTYFCPICERYLFDLDSNQIANKKIIDVSSLITETLSEQEIAAYVRQVIIRYNKIYTKLIIEDIYQYLQNNLQNNITNNRIKRVIKG